MKEGTRRLDVVLHSAAGLKKGSMAVYAVAWMEPSVRVPTSSAHGTHPVWNTTVTLALQPRTLSRATHLHIELLGHGLVSTRRVGFVSVDMSRVLGDGSQGRAVRAHFPAHPVKRVSGRQQGFLTFEVHLHESPHLLAVPETIPRVVTFARSPTATNEKPQLEGFSFVDDVITDDSDHRTTVPTRIRTYALRPKSFNFTSFRLSCH